MKRQRFPTFGQQSMLWLRRFVGIVCVCAGASVVRAQAAQETGSLAVTAITRITLIDPALETPVPDAVIVLQGERIIAAGPRRDVAIPRGAAVIDGRGKYAIPGLWDMHTHVAQPVARGVDIATTASYFFPLFIAYGVTGVRDMGGDVSLLRRWRAEIDSGTRVGPRLIVTGEKLGMAPVVRGAPFPVRTARDIDLSLKGLKDSGAVFVKLNAVRPELFGHLTRSAWALGMRVAGHAELQYSVRDLARMGLRSVEHLDGVALAANTREATLRRDLQRNERRSLWHRLLVKARIRRPIPYPEAAVLQWYSPARADSLFDTFRETGTWQCPTLRLLGVLYRQTNPHLRLAPESLLTRAVATAWNGYVNAPFDAAHPLTAVYPHMQSMVRAMSARGVGLLAGTDTPGLAAVPGRALHEELGLLVAAGLSPREALRAATTAAGDYLEARDSLGTIRAGAVADIVILEGDPLSDIANTRRISAVVARGRHFDRTALDALIAEGAATARRVRVGTP